MSIDDLTASHLENEAKGILENEQKLNWYLKEWDILEGSKAAKYIQERISSGELVNDDRVQEIIDLDKLKTFTFWDRDETLRFSAEAYTEDDAMDLLSDAINRCFEDHGIKIDIEAFSFCNAKVKE